MTEAASKTDQQASSAVACCRNGERECAKPSPPGAEEPFPSGSIAEISRQVAESAKMSGQAVEDASRTDAIVQRPGRRGGKNRRRGRPYLADRRPNQSARTERDDRGRARRGGRKGIRRGRLRSEESGDAKPRRQTEEISAQIGHVQGATGQAVVAISGHHRNDRQGEHASRPPSPPRWSNKAPRQPRSLAACNRLRRARVK